MEISFNQMGYCASDEISAAVSAAVSDNLSDSLCRLSFLRKKLGKDREKMLSSLSAFHSGGSAAEAEKDEAGRYKKALASLEADGTKQAYALFNAKCFKLAHISAKCSDSEHDIKNLHFKKRLTAIEKDIAYIDAAAYRIQKQMMKG